MTELAPKTATDFILPASVITKVDVSRLVAELEKLDNDLTSRDVRAKVGVGESVSPALSISLTEFLHQNNLKPTTSRDRSELIAQLHKLKDNLPVVHMTFAREADGQSLQQLTEWLRASVHPQAVIAVGLQPGLVAGVYLRTPNHVHDFSLRTKLAGSRSLLVKELEALRGSN